MNAVKKLSLLTMVLTMASCNEKISPELQNAGVTGSSTPVAPGEYYFKISDSSPAMLNYKLHKTGEGNSTAACEVRNTTGINSDTFRGAPAANDISCYFEAEELSLYHQGMKFKIESSPNTCDYVGYSPFSFYDRIPGNSTDTLVQVSCLSQETTDANVVTAAAAAGLDLASTTGAAGCNEWVSAGIASGTREKFIVSNDADLCRFNYTTDKCDIGIITVRNFQVTYTPPGDNPVTQPAILKGETVQRTINCGGKIASCVKGPIELVQTGTTRVTEITNSVMNETFTKEYTLPALLGPNYASVKRYSNYRRNLASTEIDYVASAGLGAGYKSAFSDPTFGKTFNTSVMDFYASNKKLDGTTLIDTAMWDAYSYPNNQYKAVPYAADPYLGMVSRVNPFYTFYCFDTAFDIKARIRMVVREWDRVFPTTADNEYVSDIFKASNSRQDNEGYFELPDDNDVFIPFNDLADWDDFIPMERTFGVFDPTLTIWRPAPDGIYLDGFFNPSYFTNSGL